MSSVVVLNEVNFSSEVLDFGGIVAVGFFQRGTPSEENMCETLSQMAAKAAGKIKVGQVDVAAAPNLAQQYRVESVPKLMIFHGGKPTS